MQQGNFQYLITTKFDAAGIAAANAAVRESSAVAAAAAGADTSNSKKAEEATGRLTDAKRRLGETVRGVALQFPVLGRLTQAFLNPWIAGVGLATAALARLHHASLEYKRTLASGEWATFTAGQYETAEALAKAAEESQKYQRKLEELTASSRSFTEAINAEIAALEARSRAMQEIDEARKGRDLAKVDAAEKTGQITAVEATKQRAKIEDEYAARQKARQDKQAKETLQFRESELEALKWNIAQSQQALSKLEAQKKQVRPPEAFDSDIESVRARIASTQEQMGVRQKRLDELQSPWSFWQYATGSASAEVRALPGLIEGDKELLNRLTNILERLTTEGGRSAVVGDNLDSRISSERSLLEGRVRRRDQLEVELPRLRNQFELETQTRGQVYDIQKETRALQTQAAMAPAPGGAPSGERIARNAMHDSGASPFKSAVNQMVEADLSETSATFNEVLEQFRAYFGEISGLRQQFTRSLEEQRRERIGISPFVQVARWDWDELVLRPLTGQALGPFAPHFDMRGWIESWLDPESSLKDILRPRIE